MISVIIPIYNAGEYLAECVESVRGQTFSDLEIILVDDGSTDGSSRICDGYRERDSRVKVVHKENGGLVSARKAGLQVATGQYVAYVDSDDWIEPDMYEHMAAKMADADIVMCGHYEDTGDARKEVFHGIPEGRYGKEGLLRDVYPRMVAGDSFFDRGVDSALWDKLFRRECLERFQMAVDERIRMGEDAACVWPCLLNAGSICVMHACLYHYRQGVSSMVKQVPGHGAEREQFGIFYRFGKAALERDRHIFDLSLQWKTYVLFLMLPRADSLYHGFGGLDYLFPFPKVRRGSDIILYGAGAYGQRLYRYLERTGFCHVVAWVDRNHRELGRMGLPVEDPGVIPERQYDGIVIANTYDRSRKGLYRELLKKYPKEKIHMLDEELMFSQETARSFGLEGGEAEWETE